MTWDERLSHDFNKEGRQYFPMDPICKRLTLNKNIWKESAQTTINVSKLEDYH